MTRYFCIVALAFSLGLMGVLFLAREHTFSEQLFLINGTGRATAIPGLVREGIVTGVDTERSVLILKSPNERGPGTPIFYAIESGPETNITKRSAVRDGAMVVGVTDTQEKSIADIEIGSYAAVSFHPDPTSSGTFKARAIIFGDFPIGL